MIYSLTEVRKYDGFPPESNDPYYSQFCTKESNFKGVEVLLFHSNLDIRKESFLQFEMMAHFCCAPNYYTQLSNINAYAIIYTISGSGRMEYLNNTYDLPPGTGFFVDCNNLVRYCNASDTKWEFLFVFINGDAAHDYYSYFFRLNGPTFHLDFNSDFYRSFCNLFIVPKSEVAHKKIVISHHLTDMIFDIITNGNVDYEDQMFAPKWVTEMRINIEKNFQHKFSLDDFAGEYSISKSHISHEFKKYIGFSPIEYLIKMRINYAKNLLQFTNMSVEEIVYICGMNNVNHFIQLFKKSTGLTPIIFRRSKA